MGARGPKHERVLFLSEHFFTHPKIRALSDAEFRCWVGVLLEQLANGNAAALPEHLYGLSRRRVERLLELGLLEEEEGRLLVHGWDQWNGREAYKRFLNRERVRRHRERRSAET